MNTSLKYKTLSHTITTSPPAPMPRAISGTSDAEFMLNKYLALREAAAAATGLAPVFYDDCVNFYAARVEREKVVSIGYMDNTHYVGLESKNQDSKAVAGERREAFLAKLRETGDVEQAREACGISLRTLTNWRQYNLSFRAQFNQMRVTGAMRVLAFVKAYYPTYGNFPTIREIMAGIGVTSTSLIRHYLRLLEGQKLIVRRGEGKSRRYTLPEVLEALKSL